MRVDSTPQFDGSKEMSQHEQSRGRERDWRCTGKYGLNQSKAALQAPAQNEVTVEVLTRVSVVKGNRIGSQVGSGYLFFGGRMDMLNTSGPLMAGSASSSRMKSM